jgi:hypothetical protein
MTTFEVRMRLILSLSAAFAVVATLALPSWGQTPAAAPRAADQKRAVGAVVAEFGRRLRMVAVMAPKDIAAKAMDQEYSTLVAADLLARWKNNPEKAPGKRTSSPSPERIEIRSIQSKGRDAYLVKGKVILLTAQERRDGGVFQANPVTLTVSQQNRQWVITAYKETEAPPEPD